MHTSWPPPSPKPSRRRRGRSRRRPEPLQSFSRGVMGPHLPSGVQRETDEHGLARLRIAAPAAEAVVYFQGAHVTHYRPRGAAPVLFTSARSRFARGEPIRGGVPVIFPWFGPHPSDPSAPAHGWARTSSWTLHEVARAG